MYCLSNEQIEYILNDIRRRGVDMEDLQSNLLDHICCIIEQELEAGGDFGRFYQQTIERFYKKELQEIEDETIKLLTFKNYYAMKKLMIVSGTFSAIAFIIGSFFKIMHWPATSALLVLAMTVFSLVFMPLVFILKTKEAGGTRDRLILAAAVIVGMLYSLSAMFLVQHWPGARIMWFSTLILSFFVLMPLYFFNGIRKQETKLNTIVTTVILMAVLGVQFTLTATRPNPNTIGKVYTYLKTEELLDKAQSTSPVTDKASIDIQNTCERIKSFILQQDIGMMTIPANFEQVGINIIERDANIMFDMKEGKQLLADLKAKVDAYNAANATKIPVDHSILEPGFIKKGFCSNLYALNDISQLQLFVANTRSIN